MFLKSIKVGEKVEQMPPSEDKDFIEETLNPKNNALHGSVIFEAEESLPAITNMAEFLLANDPIQKVEILYWLTRALETSRDKKKEDVFDRVFVQKALLTNSIEDLRSVLP